MSKKNKLCSLPAAIRTILKEGDKALAIRPSYWVGTGEALIHHGGNFYRMPMGEVGAPYSLSASDSVSRWEVISQEAVTEEALNPEPMPESSDDAPKKRRGRKPRDPNAVPKAKNPDGRRGRPAASEVAAAHPGWAGVADAAALCGVNAQKIRQAIKDGKLPVITDRACTLVELDKVREHVPASVPGRGRPRKEKALPVSEDVPVLFDVPAVANVPAESYS